MDAAALAVIAGVLLSLAFSYIPGLNKWFEGIAGNAKRLIMLGLLAVVALAVYGIACLGWWDVGVVCDQAGAIALGEQFILAMIANQSAYLISPK